MAAGALERTEALAWLAEDDEDRLEELWRRADAVRRERVGDVVHLRGLVEISNHCSRTCRYCGINARNHALSRYRMTADEIVESAERIARLEYGTIVLQAGEDPGIGAGWLADVVRRIKSATGLSVTLGMGERPREELAAWRDAGADRYLLKFETSDRDLYLRIHPNASGEPVDRIALLGTLKELGYEAGSGVMIGIPGQTLASLADDIEVFASLDLDMVGVGPFLPHPDTELGREFERGEAREVPNTALMTCKVVALTRLACPEANIPSTTALSTLGPEARALGLNRGANIVMPNLTPMRYRALYEIYPAKAKVDESALSFPERVADIIRSLGREVGTGPGGRARR